MDFKTTEEIEVPKSLMDQVIGQDEAVRIVKMAASQRRHLLLVGPPGVGKSMLARAMAEEMRVQELTDVLLLPNPKDENRPKVMVLPTYPTYAWLEAHPEFRRYFSRKELEEIRAKSLRERRKILQRGLGQRILEEPVPEKKPLWLIPLAAAGLLAGKFLGVLNEANQWFVAAIVGAALLFYFLFMSKEGKVLRPRLLIDNTGRTKPPFVDATGLRAGGLLGDVRHDPFQSGGLGVPPHLRVEPGAIHRAHGGVLFIDEIGDLASHWAHELLTALQEKEYPISGKSELSAGAMVQTDPIPCDFVLVAAGDPSSLRRLPEAFRSRILGNGYEVLMKEEMPDTPENRFLLARFVAQEVRRDGRIPHFTREAVEEVIQEARRRARPGFLTLRLRDLGGLVRAAGDLARKKGKRLVEVQEVREALALAASLEEKLATRISEKLLEEGLVEVQGTRIGRVNGLGVIGGRGMVMPIIAVVTEGRGRVYPTGGLGKKAKEAVLNTWAVLKKAFGRDFSKHDVHLQFLHYFEGVEGESASLAVALAVISDLFSLPARQNLAITGALSVRGEVLPVGGLHAKFEAAKALGLTLVCPRGSGIPGTVEVSHLAEAVEAVFAPSPERERLLRALAGLG